MTEPFKVDSMINTSAQSTPTPPNSGRSRRSARKCATPIKSAEKVEKDEFVTVGQATPLPRPAVSRSAPAKVTSVKTEVMVCAGWVCERDGDRGGETHDVWKGGGEWVWRVERAGRGEGSV